MWKRAFFRKECVKESYSCNFASYLEKLVVVAAINATRSTIKNWEGSPNNQHGKFLLKKKKKEKKNGKQVRNKQLVCVSACVF